MSDWAAFERPFFIHRKACSMTTYTQAHLAALEEAYASGATRVTYEGKSIEYRSLVDLDQAIRRVKEGLAAASGATPCKPSRNVTLISGGRD